METIIIDGVKYEVKPLSLELAPYAARLSELLQKTPVDIAEAEKFSEEIKRLREKILSETVTPSPPKEHSIQLYNQVNKLTQEVMEQARLFRKPRKPNVKKSGATGSDSTQTSK